MLKVVPPIGVSQQTQAKCGEIFFHSCTDFTIYCCFCNFKLFAFVDFLSHIQNVHFVNNLLKTQTITEVCEQLTKINVDNGETEVIEPKKELDRFETDGNFENVGSIFEAACKDEETCESDGSYDTEDYFENSDSNFKEDCSDESLLKVLNFKPDKIHVKRRIKQIDQHGKR